MAALVGAAVAVQAGVPSSSGPIAPAKPVQQRVGEAYGQLPLSFVENRGQSDARVRYLANGSRYGFYFTPDSLVMSMLDAGGDHGVNLALDFVGANPDVSVGPANPTATTANYLRGDTSTGSQAGLRTFGGVVYRELWPGVTLAVNGRDGVLKYEFRVAPGAQVGDIELTYRGTDGDLATDAAGRLLIDTAIGALRDEAPVSYQVIDGRRVPVDSRYRLTGAGGAGGAQSYGFTVGGYDPTQELVIDPGLEYSTFLGGAANQNGAAIAVDASGNAYVTGFTQSSTFPTTPGAFDRTGSVSTDLDAFVSKLNPAGTALVYSTFLGGSNFEWGRDIAVDAAGNAYVAGQTKSSNFPTTSGAFDRTFNVGTCPRCGVDQYDAFVTKLNPSGSQLVYSTFLGGTDIDDILALAVDGSGQAYVAGQTTSSNFPTTAGAFDTTAGGGYDAFVAKFNAQGSRLVYSTRLGGTDNELPGGIAVDAAGNVVLGGSTRSADYPTTAGALQRTHSGGSFADLFEGFVTKLHPARSTPPSTAPSSRSWPSSTRPARHCSTRRPRRGQRRRRGGQPGRQRLAGRQHQLAGLVRQPRRVGQPVQRRHHGRVRGRTEPVRLRADLRHVPRRRGQRQRRRPRARPGRGRLPDRDHPFGGLPDHRRAFDRVCHADPNLLGSDAWIAKLAVGPDAPTPPVQPPAPAAPTLLGPASAATVALPVTFTWAPGTGGRADAASYTIQVDDTSTFSTALTINADVTATEFTTADLPAGMSFWRVRALSADGTPSLWSQVRSVIGPSAPPAPPAPALGAPSLLSPADGGQAGQPFTFDWSDVAGAAWYRIDVSDDPSFGSLVWAATTTPSQLATNSLPNGSSLFWRVRAFNSDGVGGAYSATRAVTVK